MKVQVEQPVHILRLVTSDLQRIDTSRRFSGAGAIGARPAFFNMLLARK